MKLSVCVVVLGLVLVNNNAFAANVATMNLFLESETCQGEASLSMPIAVENQCMQLDGSSSKATCSDVTAFATPDCSGAGEKNTAPFQCTPDAESEGVSTIAKCESIPDNKIAKFQVGESCGNNDAVESIQFEGILVVETCRRFSIEDLTTSFKLIVTDTGLNVTVFTEKTDCTGAFVGLPIQTGSCQLADAAVLGIALLGRRRLAGEGEQLALKIVPAIAGASLGSNAVVSSVGVLALLVSMIAGVFAAMF